VGDFSGVSESYSRQSHSPVIEAFWQSTSSRVGSLDDEELLNYTKTLSCVMMRGTFVVTRWNINRMHKCLTIYTACLLNYTKSLSCVMMQADGTKGQLHARRRNVAEDEDEEEEE
jgi:hypothetical protein